MGERVQAEEMAPQMTIEERIAAGFQELRTELQFQIDRQLRTLMGDQQGRLNDQNVGVQQETQEQERPASPRGNRVREATVVNFLKLKPPTFCGTEEGEDPQDFIQDIERIEDVLKCPGAELADLATFQLRG